MARYRRTPFHQFDPNRRRERAINQHRLEVDHGADRQGRLGQLLRGFPDPRFHIAAEIGPVLWLMPEHTGVDPGLNQPPLEQMDRRHVDQLLAFPQRPRTAQGPERPGVSLIALEHGVIDDNAAADKRTDEEIRPVAEVVRAPVEVFGTTGRSGVVHHEDRQVREARHLFREIQILPRFEPL